jgi:hypothetical protein
MPWLVMLCRPPNVILCTTTFKMLSIGLHEVTRRKCLRTPCSVNGLKPSVLPKYQATSLAPPVSVSITAVLEMDGVRQVSADVLAGYGIAGLVCPFVDLEALAAILKHLRHEWEPFEPTIRVKSL